jgi:hypothetical protein
MAKEKRQKRKKKNKNRLGDVPGMIMLLVVLVYSVVLVVDGVLLCRSGLFGAPECDCPEQLQEVVIFTGGESTPLEEGKTVKYFHDALKVAFDYPAEWGPVTIREEMARDPYGKQIVVGLMLYFRDMAEQSGGGLFMHANNPNTDPTDRRLDYWGTDAVEISSAHDLRGWCTGKTDCEYITNSHGVQIAKQRINPAGAAFDVYYLHNPRGGYNGVAVSMERLDAKFGAANLLDGFDELIDSIQLLD